MATINRLVREFLQSERSAGFVLIGSTVISLLAANLFFGSPYIEFFHRTIGIGPASGHLHLSIEQWVNDGLMAIFFLLVALEIKQELYTGELSGIKKASLPAAAALGGMIFPFLFHLLINHGTAAQAGAGIPMATDIAFALGVLSLARKVPFGLKIFLTAFAIIDDLGAIIVIAVFYTREIQWIYLLAAAMLFAMLLTGNRLKLGALWVYLVLGLGLWYCMLLSGVHATVAGVLLAFALPFNQGSPTAVSYRVQHFLHKPVAFIILPVFAIVNTAIAIPGSWLHDLHTNNSLGILLGLVAGKPVGILLFCVLIVKSGLGNLPAGVGWRQLAGAATLGGVGFTMSIFITLLAFDDQALISQSKLAIMVASLTASLLGLLALRMAGKRNTRPADATTIQT